MYHFYTYVFDIILFFNLYELKEKKEDFGNVLPTHLLYKIWV